MRLSVQTDYALRTLMLLAARGGLHSIAEISASYGISRNHMMKVANRLVAEGFAESVRGRTGGLRLARAPEDIRVGQVVAAIEELDHVVECFDGTTNQCKVLPACGLHSALTGAVQAFLQHLDRFTISDLIKNPDRFSALLER